MQILSSTILEPRKKFEVWIPVEGSTIIPAVAKTEWMVVEETFGDSPYWVRGGLSLAFRNDEDRRLIAEEIRRRSKTDRVRQEQENSKVGFVF